MATGYALPVFEAPSVLAAVDFDDQAPLPAKKVDVAAIDRLLADKFETAELTVTNAPPERKLCWRECAPQ